MSNFNDVFKERFKKLFDEKGVTKTQMSRETGISVYRITTWLNGTRKPNTKHLLPLSDYFDVSTDFLCCLTQKRK